MPNKEKIALVASGGGMSCSYAAGAITALAQEHGFLNPDIAIAGSGSAGTLAYYSAGQVDKSRKIWIDLLSSRRFINLFRFWRIIDIDYLIDSVFRTQEPLDFEKAIRSKIKLLIAATNYDTGDLTYFSTKNRADKEELYELLRASKALPLAFNKRVYLDGNPYCDSYLSANLDAHIREAIMQGATKIIAINNTVKRPVNESLFRGWVVARGKKFSKHYYKQLYDVRSYKVPSNIEIIYLKPSEHVAISTFKRNFKGLQKTFNLGYSDMESHQEIKNLLRI